MVDEIVVLFEDPVRKPVVAHELPHVLNRVELGTFWWQRDDGDVGRYDEACRHVPAGWSTKRTAWAAGAMAAAISARCRFIASVLQAGRIRAAPLPRFGHTAPQI